MSGPDPLATTYASRAMVCSIDHLATGAGLAMLRDGGSAADAAIAANAVLAVIAPHLCGLGGDLFALVHHGVGEPSALMAGGRAGSGADGARLRAEGHRLMPFRLDIRSVPVPGCVDGWLALHARFGKRPLEEVMAPAVTLARDGFAASGLLAASAVLVRDIPGALDLRAATRPGAQVRRRGVAAALEAIVHEGRAGFYEGAFGRGLVELGGGEYTPEDLRAPLATWEPALGVDAFGRRIWVVPPPSQGYVVALAAALADRIDLPSDPEDPAWAHLLIEGSIAAAHDRNALLHEHLDGTSLVALHEISKRAEAIDRDRHLRRDAPTRLGDTTYVCAIDADGMAVSLIQSNAADFGAHIFEPATGIGLHNRGIGFSLADDHPAAYGPGRRPPSTLTPALITDPTGELVGVVGTMGGDVQPQIVLQLLARLLHSHQRPGRAVPAARFALARSDDRGFDLWDRPDELEVTLEAGSPPMWAPELEARGHRVRVLDVRAGIGHAHTIVVTADGTLAGAADRRAGAAVALGL